MEKYYQDYAYNLALAVQWYKRIGSDKRAEAYWQAHLEIANSINQRFKELYRA